MEVNPHKHDWINVYQIGKAIVHWCSKCGRVRTRMLFHVHDPLMPGPAFGAEVVTKEYEIGSRKAVKKETKVTT